MDVFSSSFTKVLDLVEGEKTRRGIASRVCSFIFLFERKLRWLIESQTIILRQFYFDVWCFKKANTKWRVVTCQDSLVLRRKWRGWCFETGVDKQAHLWCFKIILLINVRSAFTRCCPMFVFAAKHEWMNEGRRGEGRKKGRKEWYKGKLLGMILREDYFKKI